MTPTVFIASSLESLPVARAIQENLDYSFEPVVWDQDVFKPSMHALDALQTAARTYEYAVFVLTPDDTVILRKNRRSIPRDNLLFELGLFIGALGSKRCFMVVPRDTEKLHLPTDLLGVVYADYDPHRERLTAALGAACTKIASAIQRDVASKGDNQNAS